MLSKKILKKIPIIKRIYPSLMKIFYKKKKIKFKFFNLDLEGNFSDPMDKEIFLFNNYENLQIQYLITNIKKYNLKYFIDIGANSGVYSLIIKDKFPKIKVKYFEPIKETVDKFKNNLKINKLKKIQIYNFGLSNKNSKLQMRAKIKDGYIQSGGYGVVEKGDDLTNLHLENNIFKVGDNIIKLKNKDIAIKIDVEGHEYKVLQGIKKVQNYNQIFLQIEIFDKNFSKVDKYLKKQKFKLVNSIYNDGKTDYFYKNFT